MSSYRKYKALKRDVKLAKKIHKKLSKDKEEDNTGDLSQDSGKKDRDYFGFPNDYQYDRTVDYPKKKPTKNLTLIIIGIVILVVGIILITAFSMSGYIAWNSFTNDPVWLKVFKTYLAVIFSPIYLFYIFIKSVIFNLPN